MTVFVSLCSYAGAKRMLRIATETGTDPDGIKDLLRPILRQNLVDTDFLASTLWPNNPSLHPPILYGLFKNWDGKQGFDASTLPVAIYGEMTDASAKVRAAASRLELPAHLTALRILLAGGDGPRRRARCHNGRPQGEGLEKQRRLPLPQVSPSRRALAPSRRGRVTGAAFPLPPGACLRTTSTRSRTAQTL